MFVLEALTLTCLTTPLVTVFYPPDKRIRLSASGASFNSVSADEANPRKFEHCHKFRKRFTVVLDKLEHVPGMMALTQLIQSPVPLTQAGSGSSASTFIEALRLIELSDRVSAVMKSSASDTLLHSDPLLAIFRVFGQLNDITINTALSIVTYDNLSNTVTEHARNNESDMIMLPWLPPTPLTQLDNSANEALPTPKTVSQNPFDVLFKTSTVSESSPSAIHSTFVCNVFSKASTDVALFVDQGGSVRSSSQHLFLPFFGGPDDRLALGFVAQLCENPKISATVIRVTKRDVEVTVSSAELAHTTITGIQEGNTPTVASVSLYHVMYVHDIYLCP